MDCPFESKYPYHYIANGTSNGFYAYGSMWDYSNPMDNKSSKHFAYVICNGYDELVDEGSYCEPPLYEPLEVEMIVVRPILKYPKR